MNVVAITLVLGLASWLAWAACVTFVAGALQRHFPDVYARVGSPTLFQLWWMRGFRSVPKAFDRVTLSREFRRFDIGDSRVVIGWELVYCLRWLQVLCVVAFALALLASALSPHAP